MLERKEVGQCVNTYMAECAKFRERVLREALPLWVSEVEPCLMELHHSGLGVDIIGLCAVGSSTVSVPFPAKLTVALKR